jgi:hypothetical protein
LIESIIMGVAPNFKPTLSRKPSRPLDSGDIVEMNRMKDKRRHAPFAINIDFVIAFHRPFPEAFLTLGQSM